MTTTVDAFFRLFSWNFFRYLNESFILPDHAQLKTGPLLDGIVTLLQIANLGIEARVPDFQLPGHFLLLLQLTVVFPNPQPPSLPQPERVLEEANGSEEADRQPTHHA